MKRFAFAFAFFIAFLLDCSAQTLADIARQERERQRQVRSSTRTVVSGVAGATSIASSGTAAATSAVVTAPAAASSTAQAPKGPLDSQGRDEKYWRGEFQKARDELKRAEANVQILDLRIKELNTQILQNSGIYNRENRLGPEVAAAQQQLEAARKQVEAAKQRILDLEDALRRAGGLPGWAR